MSSTNPKARLSKEVWLDRALDLLKEEGPSCLALRHLTKKLGVTTGSFYWHFKNIDDFVEQIMSYWEQEFTIKTAKLTTLSGTPEQRLTTLSAVLINTSASRYDVSIRAWGNSNENVAAYVKKVDHYRTKVIRDIFSELGYSGNALSLRVQIYITFISLNAAILYDKEEASLVDLLPEFLDILLRKD
jgi:AcrR family transcriptional regulator